MGVITISMDDKSEKLLRELAKAKYGDRKDAISKTIVETISQTDTRREEAIARLRRRMFVNPIKIGKGGKMPKTRAEIYER
ncbi:MAG: hypothetical protein PHU32_04285 [Candidatus ainarchaeum sp.]|nr:hypothetical protein [Candidatus ainarchaeum sp.]